MIRAKYRRRDIRRLSALVLACIGLAIANLRLAERHEIIAAATFRSTHEVPLPVGLYLEIGSRALQSATSLLSIGLVAAAAAFGSLAVMAARRGGGWSVALALAATSVPVAAAGLWLGAPSDSPSRLSPVAALSGAGLLAVPGLGLAWIVALDGLRARDAARRR